MKTTSVEMQKLDDQFDKKHLIALLCDCPSLRNTETRRSLLTLLPTDIADNINIGNGIKYDVLEFVNRCTNYPDGIKELFEAVRFFDEKTLPFQTLSDFLAVQELTSESSPTGVLEKVETPITELMAQLNLSSQLRASDEFTRHNHDSLQLIRETMVQLKQLSPQTPEYSRVSLIVGSALSSTGELLQAERLFTQVIENTDKNSEKGLAHFNLFQVQLRRKVYQEALENLQSAIKINPHYALHDINKYPIEWLLGAGGMGCVFLCRNQNRLIRYARVVVKCFWEEPKGTLNKVFKEPFTMRDIAGDYIPEPLDIGYVDPIKKERAYFVTEYIDGAIDGEAWLEKYGPMDLETGLQVGLQIAKGLQIAHDAGICHLDLKPANILLKQTDNEIAVRIIDFGLSKIVPSLQQKAMTVQKSRAEFSQFGQEIFGTLDYACPEQQGLTQYGKPGVQCDIFGFGATISRFFTGKNLRYVRERDLPKVEALRDLLGDCVEENPKKRPKSAQLLVSHLAEQKQKVEAERKRKEDEDKNAWKIACQKNTPSAYQEYLNGKTIKKYADEAKLRLQAIEKERQAQLAEKERNRKKKVRQKVGQQDTRSADKKHFGSNTLKQIRLSTKYYSHVLTGVIVIAVFLLPLVVSWIYLNAFYTTKEIGCDGDFWQTTIGNHFTFPFEFFAQMLITNPYMWIVLFIGIGITIFWFKMGFQWLRLRDFPKMIVGSFFILSVLSGLIFFQSIDLFTKLKIEKKLTDDAYRNGMFNRNLETLGNALANQVGIVLLSQELKTAARQARFSDDYLFDRIGVQAAALFDKTDSKLALFETCKESTEIKILIEEKDDKGNLTGFSKEVSIDAIMPISYQNIAKKGGLGKKFDYFIDVFGVHYLFGWFWWVYYFLIMIPVWFFFGRFMLYAIGILKIKGQDTRSAYKKHLSRNTLKQIRLSTKYDSRVLIGTIIIAVLLLPLVASWIYLNAFYTAQEIGCDGDFWRATIDNHFLFPFEFFEKILLTNPYMWIVLFIGIGFTIFCFKMGFQWLRLRDFPFIFVVVPFFILSSLAVLAGWASLDLFAKSKIEEKLTDNDYRSGMFSRNLETLGNVLANQVGIVLLPQELEKAARQARFSDDDLFDRIGVQAAALFDKTDSKVALFETCQESMKIKILIEEKDNKGKPTGFTEPREVSIDAIMPIGYQNIVNNGKFGEKFDYFIDVFGVHYLLSWFWWVYYFLIMMPVWFFFGVFMLYQFGFFKVKGEV